LTALVADRFDYESKAFGTARVRVSPVYIPALKLKYALEDLEDVRGRLLDIGCGGGGMTQALHHYRPDLEVWGLDFSQGSVALASREDDGVRYCLGDAYRLPFDDSRFDGVVVFDFLEHLDDPARVLSEVRRVLVPGGILHMAVPFEGEPRTIHGLLWALGWRAKVVQCGHVQMYRFGQPETLIKAAGLRIEKRRWTAHFVYQMVDVVYFTLLSISGMRVSYSVEGQIEASRPGVRKWILSVAKAAIATITYVESSLLYWLPAGFGHLKCVRAGQ
jgi:SAM-dependent methyltransferase